MADFAGGARFPPFVFNLMSPQNTPKQADLLGLDQSSTGARLKASMQTDNDSIVAIGSGSAVNAGGNSNVTFRHAKSFAKSFFFNVQQVDRDDPAAAHETKMEASGFLILFVLLSQRFAACYGVGFEPAQQPTASFAPGLKIDYSLYSGQF